MRHYFLETSTFVQFLVNLAKLIFLVHSLFTQGGCTQEKQEVFLGNPKTIQFTKLKKTGEFTYPEVDCNEATLTCQTPCYCGIGAPAGCCVIEDLYPCNDTSGYQYAYRFACNINKIINNCVPMQLSQNCRELGKICFDFGAGSVPDVLTNIIPGADPFEYCSQAICSTFVCSDGSTPVRHFPMSVTYQNAVATYIDGLRTGLTSGIMCRENET